MSGAETPVKVKGLVVPTRYTTVDELVNAIHPFSDHDCLFIASPVTREVGVESPFAILLADRTPAIRGWCVVIDVYNEADESPFERPGMVISLHRLTPDSQRVFDMVQAARLAAE